MKQWLIKELSSLANISVRTLHHYDQIDLLKPSGRSENGYRWYAEKDLIRLQQIIALKFFGFGLTQIKTMLQQEPNLLNHLQTQERMLKEQLTSLQHVQATMTNVIQKLNNQESPNWQDLVALIERYHMTEELKTGWAGQALNESQFTQWISMWEKHPHLYSAWKTFNDKINAGNLGDPEGPEGIQIVKDYMHIAEEMMKATSLDEQIKFNAELSTSIKEGSLTTLPLSPEGQLWFSKACLAYNLKRWQNLHQDITQHSAENPEGPAGKKLAQAWRNLLAINTSEKLSPDFIIGTMVWQQLGQQHAEMRDRTTPLTPQEIFSKAYCGLVFDAAALNWIKKALTTHTGDNND